MTLRLLLLPLLLWATAVRAEGPPIPPVEVPPTDTASADSGGLLNRKAPTIYGMIRFPYTPGPGARLDRRLLTIQLNNLLRQDLTGEERELVDNAKYILAKDTREAYDWFLQMLEPPETPEAIAAATGVAHVQFFAKYLSDHLKDSVAPHARLTLADHQREIVRFLSERAIGDQFPYLTAAMIEFLSKANTGEEVRRELQRTFSYKWPVIAATCIFVLVGAGLTTWKLWPQGSVSGARERIKNGAQDQKYLRQPPNPEEAPVNPKDDPEIREAEKLGEMLPPVKSVKPK